jgi:Anti-sigma factor NepR
MTKSARLRSDIPLPRRSAVPMSSMDDHGLDANQRGRLGAQLRAMFQEIVTEPLPDRFQRLLDELARKERIENDQQ